jgi:phosphoribosylamine--glycine ligase
VLPRLETDIYDVFSAVADHTSMPELKWNEKVTMGFVMASKGYPGDYDKGFEIEFPDSLCHPERSEGSPRGQYTMCAVA